MWSGTAFSVREKRQKMTCVFVEIRRFDITEHGCVDLDHLLRTKHLLETGSLAAWDVCSRFQ